jgi:NitT/TauT family transport system ATP-binding protein
MVKVSDLALTYQSAQGEIEAIENISFCVQEGELSALSARRAAEVDAPVHHRGAAGAERRKRDGGLRLGVIGYMLQKDSLFPWRSIRQNVMLGLEVRGDGTKSAAAYVDHLLKTYGLWDFRGRSPRELSGGMRQRCALIRTLAVRPQLLLLDEAFSGLDYQTRLAVADDIHAIIRREGKRRSWSRTTSRRP